MDSHAKDLLIADHKYIGELLQKNEQGGETRVNLFITLSTAGIGGLFALMSKGGAPGLPVRAIVAVGLVFLFVIGCVTWLRMIKRDLNTDLYKTLLDDIRRRFKVDPSCAVTLADYNLFAGSKIRIRTFGGLSDTVAVLNGFLAAGIAAAFMLPEPSSSWPTRVSLCTAIGVVTFGIAIAVFQVVYADCVERKARAGLPRSSPPPTPPKPLFPVGGGANNKSGGPAPGSPPALTHAGGIVYEVRGGLAQYLLIRPKNNANEWVLPQGHIEPGEDHAAAALREVREETGVVAAILGFVGHSQFERQNRIQVTKFYLMKAIGTTAPDDTRNAKWLPFQDAVAELSHKESKSIVQEADKLLRALNVPG